MAAHEDKQSEYTYHDYYDLFMDDTYYKPILAKISNRDLLYESKIGKDKDLSVKQYLLMIVPHLPALINDHKNESNKWNIQLTMRTCFINPREIPAYPPCLFYCNEETKPDGKRHIFDVHSDSEEIRSDVETSKIIYGLVKYLLDNYKKKKDECNLVFNYVLFIFYYVYRTGKRLPIIYS